MIESGYREGLAVLMNVPMDPVLRRLSFRAIRPDDWHELQRFHERLSLDTIEKRFHAAKRELSEPLAHRLTSLDGINENALVAIDDESNAIVGVARFSRLDQNSAEVAFVVEDAYQGHGIGSTLMTTLRGMALAQGIQVFVAEILPDNAAMFALLRECGRVRTVFRAGECISRVELAEIAIGSTTPMSTRH